MTETQQAAPPQEAPSGAKGPGIGRRITGGIGSFLAGLFGFVLNSTFGKGLLGFTTVLSFLFAIWIAYFFGVAIHRPVPADALWGWYGTLGLFTHNRIIANLAWFATVYIPLSVLSAALYPMDLDVSSKGRRVWGPLLNHFTSALPGVAMIWVYSSKKVLISDVSSLFWEAALLASAIVVMEIFSSVAVSLIVANSRKKIG